MKQRIKSYRHELIHTDDAEFIAYKCRSGHDIWETVSVWMIPQMLI